MILNVVFVSACIYMLKIAVYEDRRWCDDPTRLLFVRDLALVLRVTQLIKIRMRLRLTIAD